MNDTSTHIGTSVSADPVCRSYRELLRDNRLWLLCATFLALSVWVVNDSILYTPDSARYIIWAQSLSSFDGFHDTTSPEATRYVVHAPLYPILLAPLGWLFSNIVIPAKILTMLYAVVLIVLFYLWAGRHIGCHAALAGSFFLAFNALTLVLSSQVLSDVPFAVAVVALVLIAERMEADPASRGLALWFAVILTAAIFSREIGLTLLASAIVYLFLRKRYFALLLACSLPVFFYLSWYYRNEVYIAGIENPGLRNMKLFLNHSITPEDSSIVEEFLARIRINLLVYAEMAKGLILFPQFLTRSSPVVLDSDAVMALMSRILTYAKYPLIVVQYGLVGWGIVLKRRDGVSLFVALFFVFYFTLILLYPINDVRFLYPLLAPALYFAVAGGHALYDRLRSSWKLNLSLPGIAFGTFILLAVPTLTWLSDFMVHGARHARQWDQSSTHQASRHEIPELYMKSGSRVAQWITDHSRPTAMVLTRWKELTFWLDGRSVLECGPSVSFSEFEAVIRDYNIDFIVSFVMSPGVREFEFQMMKSKRFTFQSVFRAGNYEVMQVFDTQPDGANVLLGSQRVSPMPAILIDDGEARARDLFAYGFRALENDRSKDAFHTFSVLTETSNGSAHVAFLRGIALSFGGQFDGALSYLSRFAYEQQAGQYLMEARYHSILIREFQKAERDSLPHEKASILHKISANYWDAGYRARAQEVLKQSLKADSTFPPAMIFGLYYALEQKDLAGGKSFLSMIEKLSPPHPMLKSFRQILSLSDSAHLMKNPVARARYEFDLAKTYAVMGLNDLAIEYALRVVALEERNVRALEVLAQSYEIKRRTWPARKILKRILNLEPHNTVALEKLTALERFQ